MSSLHFILPFPPSVNACWRTVKGRILLSDKGRKFRSSAIASIIEQLKRFPKPIDHDVSVTVKMYPPTKQRRDIDNYLKAPFDALTHAKVWNDDDQVKHIDVTWCEVVKGGRFEITINHYNGEVA